MRQRNDRNSRRARDLYQRDTTRLRREKNACIQQAQNWRGRKRNTQNQINNLNQQIINLQNNPSHLQNTGMAGYAPPLFEGLPGQDPEDFINEMRRFSIAAGINIGNQAGRTQLFGIIEACLRGKAKEWYENDIRGKNWACNNILDNIGMADLPATRALTNAGVLAIDANQF